MNYADAYASGPNPKEWGVRDGAQLMPVYLAIRNPKRERIGLINEIEDDWLQSDGEVYRAELEAAGYDGIIFEGKTKAFGRVTEYVAFHPQQIKSALGNSGAFDSNSPDLADWDYPFLLTANFDLLVAASNDAPATRLRNGMR